MSGEMNYQGSARYRCSRGHRRYLDVVATRSRRRVLASAVEPQAWEAVARVLHNPALIVAELERQRDGTITQQADLDRERQQYERQLAQCDKDLKRWEAAYLDEAIDLADFKAKKTEIDTRRAGMAQELARVDEQERLLEQVELETATLTDYCRRVAHHLHHFDLAEQRLALEALHITATWHPDRPLEMHGSIPVEIASNAP